MRLLLVWRDCDKVNCGFRHYLEVKRGRKQTTLLYEPTLTLVKEDNVYLDAKAVAVAYSPKAHIGMIKRAQNRLDNSKDLDGTPTPRKYSKVVVKGVLKTLRRLPTYVLVEGKNMKEKHARHHHP